MSEHVAPHRWADAAAGKLDDDELATLERHAQACPACRRARDRVGRASDSFAAIRGQAPPELPWDSVRARVHWSVSQERRSRPRIPRRTVPRYVWGAVAVATGIGIALGTGRSLGPAMQGPAPEVAIAPVPSLAPAIAPVAVAPVVAPAAASGVVNRLAGEVLVDGEQPDDLFARRLTAGMVIATGEGRVDVQFGDASAFALGPRSTLELRRFDAERIELVVEGSIDLEVAPRKRGQRLVVVAGEHAVEVRGTRFRVVRANGTTDVACRHGLVAVRDRSSTAAIEVGAARRVQLAAGSSMSADQIVPLTVAELAVLAEATPLSLPAWDLDSLELRTAPLEITATGRRDVRVDGVELGAAPLRVRVMPGRHTVEATDRAGRFRRVGWVDVAAPTPGGAPARLEVPADRPSSQGITQRRRQLRAGIDAARLARCMRSIAKSGVTDTFVQVEISIDETGAVGFLNVIDTDLPSATATCVRQVLAEVRFGAGLAATWRERLEL